MDEHHSTKIYVSSFDVLRMATECATPKSRLAQLRRDHSNKDRGVSSHHAFLYSWQRLDFVVKGHCEL